MTWLHRLIITSALLLLLARGLTALAAYFPNQILALVSQPLGEPLSAQTLALHFDGRLLHVAATELATTELVIGEFELTLDLWASLWTRQPRIRHLGLADAALNLKRRADGSLQLNGIDLPAAQSSDGLGFFLEHGSIAFHNLQLHWQDRQQSPLKVQLVQAISRHHHQHHQLALELESPSLGIETLALKADLTGTLDQPERGAGTVQLALTLNPVRYRLPLPVVTAAIAADRLQLTSWHQIEQGQLTAARTALHVDQLQLTTPSGDFALGATQAQLHWQRQSHGWAMQLAKLRSDALPTLLDGLAFQLTALKPATAQNQRYQFAVRLDHPAVTAQASAMLLLPGGAQKSRLAWTILVDYLDLATVKSWFHADPQHPEWIQWLDQALLAGTIHHGNIHFDGARLKLHLPVTNVTLDYQPATADQLGWPALTEAAGLVQLDEQTLRIELEHAKILNTQIDALVATIADVTNPQTVAISARGSGLFRDGQRMLRDTPLAENVGSLGELLAVDGTMEVELALQVPLLDQQPPLYRGRLRWLGDATVALAPWPAIPPLQSLSGQLLFTPDHVTSSELTAQLDNTAVAIDLQQRNSGTAIQLTGSASVADLANRWPHAGWAVARGRSDWRLTVDLPQAPAAALVLHLDSDLQGLGIDLPAPLGKSADARRMLTLHSQIAPDQPLTISARYDLFGARFELAPAANDEWQVNALALHTHQLPTTLPPAGSWQFNGHLTNLALDSWLEWLQQQPTGVAVSASSALRLHSSTLKLDELSLGKQAFGPTRIELHSDDQSRLVVAVDSKPMAGTLTVANKPQVPHQLDIDHLDLTPLLANRSPPAAQEPLAIDPHQHPEHWPPLMLAVQQLRWREVPLGQAQLRLQPNSNGLELTQLKLDNPLLSLQGRGRWTVDRTGYQQSQLTLTASSPNSGALLQALGYYSGLVASAGALEFDVTWPGGAAQWSLAHARGQVQFELGAGRLLDVEPGMGRMLGILNVAAIQRRLRLDFSELMADGLGFDRIHGQLDIGQGQAWIRKLALRSSTADIEIGGLTNLITETFDQSIIITPKLGAGVALASAVAGGPLIGAAVFVADKVAGDAVNRLSRYRYQVTGPWRSPQISRVALDNGWALGNFFIDDTTPASRRQPSLFQP